MHFSTSTIVAVATLLTQVQSHGLITGIQGANGVTMPGLGLIDGTPRDCTTKGCGAQDDTPVLKEGNGPLGSTRAGGPVDAASAVQSFMGAGAANGGATGNAATNIQSANNKADAADAAEDAADNKRALGSTGRRGLLDNLLGKAGKKQKKQQGAAANAAGGAAGAAGAGGLATGTKTDKGTTEQGVAAAAGKGAAGGMPTVGQNGMITMNFHQVNGDGAGPYTAAVDPTSGGTSEAAFQPATVMMNIPGNNGNDNQGRTSDFQMMVQMPAGMQCQGTIAGMQNLCVVRVKNPARAGPFGGSAVFTQDQAAANGTATGAAGAAGSPPAAAGSPPAAAGSPPAVASPPPAQANAAQGAQGGQAAQGAQSGQTGQGAETGQTQDATGTQGAQGAGAAGANQAAQALDRRVAMYMRG